MNNKTHIWIATAIVSGLAILPSIALLQVGEIQAEIVQNGNASEVRPGQAAPPMITTTPPGAVRGSLFRQGAMRPCRSARKARPFLGLQ